MKGRQLMLSMRQNKIQSHIVLGLSFDIAIHFLSL